MQEELGKGKHLNEEHCILHALGESRVQVRGVGRKPSINNHLIPNQHYKPSKSKYQNTDNSQVVGLTQQMQFQMQQYM